MKHHATHTEKVAVLRRAIEGAPPATDADRTSDRVGWWLPLEDGDGYLCNPCACRLMGRGLSISPAEPVYRDEAKPTGVCMVCEA